MIGTDKPGTTTRDLVEPGGKNNPNSDNGSIYPAAEGITDVNTLAIIG